MYKSDESVARPMRAKESAHSVLTRPVCADTARTLAVFPCAKEDTAIIFVHCVIFLGVCDVPVDCHPESPDNPTSSVNASSQEELSGASGGIRTRDQQLTKLPLRPV